MSKKLKILLILESAGTGAGRHVIDLCQGLVGRGHCVHLLYSPFRLEKWFENAISNIKGLTILQTPIVREPSHTDFSTVRQIRQYISKVGPFDLIHGHSSKGGALARIVGTLNRCVRVYTPHAFYTLDENLSVPKRQFYRLMERILAWLSDGIICVSHVEREHALKLPISPKKLFLVNNGIGELPPADKEDSRRRIGILSEEMCIGFVGRLEPQKSVDRLIRAFAKVAAQLTNARLAIVGNGPDELKLKAIAQSLSLCNKVIWVGQGDGPALMAGFDIFAMASRYEAFPYVFLEAGARGLPIVTTEVGGAHEIISQSKNGIIVGQDDIDQLSAAILSLCQDEEKRRRMSACAKKAIEKFSLDRMVSETIDVYKATLLNGAKN